MPADRGLGRGLDALIPTKIEAEFDPTADVAADTVAQVKPERILPNPHQPRQVFDDTALAELAVSIKQHGIMQPLVVTAAGRDQYQLIAGERRLRAAKLAGLATVPVIVRTYDEQQKLELALIENIQRQDLNPIETATAYKKLMDQFNISYDQIGKRVGKERSTIANIIRLLGLPLEAKRALAEGRISEGHARAILSVAKPEQQLELLELILAQGWTVRQSENFARGFKQASGSKEAGLAKMASTSPLTERLGGYLGTKVSVSHSAKGGRLVIEYRDETELERIARLIKPD